MAIFSATAVFLVCFLVLSIPREALSSFPDDASPPPQTAQLLTQLEISKLSTKEIRKILSDRGLECKGCSEKSEFVARALEAQSLPLKNNNNADTKPAPSNQKQEPPDDEEVAKILREMQGKGFGQGNFFGDTSNIPENIKKQFNFGDRQHTMKDEAKRRKRQKSSAKDNQKPSSSRSADLDKEEDRIEL